MIIRTVMTMSVLLVSSIAWGQGRCAKVSKDVTFRFGIGAIPMDEPIEPTIVDQYHTDLELSFRSSGWAIVVSHDAPGSGGHGQDIEPNQALLFGNQASSWVLPSIPPAFSFIGAKPNEPFWILPQNSGTGALPLGIAVEQADRSRLCPWNPEDTRGADTEDLWFAMELLAVHGPADANFAMWQADGMRPPVVFMSTHEEGITADDVFYIAAGSHIHMNWGFTQPGLYEIDFRISTVLYCEESLTADWAPLGNPYFNGDCKVDLLDFAHLAAHWLQVPSIDDPNTWMFVDLNDPEDPVDHDELHKLMDQWLQCGYPGCE